MTNLPVFGDMTLCSEILKKSGYKSVSFGAAELIDNAIDWGASDIIILAESDSKNRITQLGFLDNGSGMDKDKLHKCLQVGSHFDPSNTKRNRGKYGFGLPGASSAHSNQVEVYSWQKNHPDKVYMTRLDTEKLAAGIAEPKEVKSLPEPFARLKTKNAIIKSGSDTLLGPADFYNQGTLVIWKGCERITPKNVALLFRRYLLPDLSRLFRHFISEDDYPKKKFQHCTIYLIEQLAPGKEPKVERLKPNDPLYLMEDHQYCKEFSFDYRPKFSKTFKLNKSEVEIRFSLASHDVRHKYQGRGAVNTDLGKNLGISIVREGREIDFGDFSFFDPSEDRNRFWGCEILFSKEADDYFGVPANKQHVDQLKKILTEDPEEYPEDCPANEMPIWLALDRHFNITSVLRGFLNTIRDYAKKNTGEGTPGEGLGMDQDIVDDSGEDDSSSTSGGSVSVEDDTARKNAIEAIRNIGADPTDQQIARYLQHKVVLEYKPLGESLGFMDVEIKYGVCLLKINTQSYFYRQVLSRVLEQSEEVARGVELVLLAYARCMDLDRRLETLDQFPRVLMKWNGKVEEFLRDYYGHDK